MIDLTDKETAVVMQSLSFHKTKMREALGECGDGKSYNIEVILIEGVTEIRHLYSKIKEEAGF